MSRRYGDTVTFSLTASTWETQGTGGRHLIFADISGAFEYMVLRHNRILAQGDGLRAGFGIWFPEGFDEVRLKAATTQTARIVVSDERIDYNRVTGEIDAVIAAYTAVAWDDDAAVTSTPATMTPAAGTKLVLFTASSANTALVFVAGTPLDAGEKLGLPLAIAIDYWAASGTQAIYWTEMG